MEGSEERGRAERFKGIQMNIVILAVFMLSMVPLMMSEKDNIKKYQAMEGKGA